MKSKKKVVYSKEPPPGWPSEEQFAKIEKELEKAIASKILLSNANPIDRIKQTLCAHFIRYLQAENLSQRELAKILGVSESRVSEIVHYHHQRFTIDKLIELLSIIRPKLTIKVA